MKILKICLCLMFLSSSFAFAEDEKASEVDKLNQSITQLTAAMNSFTGKIEILDEQLDDLLTRRAQLNRQLGIWQQKMFDLREELKNVESVPNSQSQSTD